MKAYVVQPEYSLDYSKSDELFQWEIETLENIPLDADIIVLPEYSNVPAYAKTKAEMQKSYKKYNDSLMSTASETAKRCSATVFVNGMFMTETGLRNTTMAYDKTGNLIGTYFKQHLVPSEMGEYALDKDYTYDFSEPTIIEIDNIRYGFLVCYDCYFYEMYANIARYNPDILIVCAYQRSDTHDTLETMSKFCAYNTNTYILRSSVSLGSDSLVGGCSMIVTPEGKILTNMKNDVGFASAEINPKKRHLKPAGFGNPSATHHSYIEAGRRPWKYRPGGSAICPDNKNMHYPRICAHRGFNTVLPENSLPAFGAAVALGAEEIEFDLWSSKDGVIVSAHDESLERISGGTGKIWEYTYNELLNLDFGTKFSKNFNGLKIATLEEILKKFACHIIMNIHIKSPDCKNPISDASIKKIVALLKKYDCENYVYFMSGNPAVLAQLKRLAPHIERCAGASDDPHEDLVAKAIAADAKKIQLFKPHFKYNDKDYIKCTIEKAHALGIRCNVFFADDATEAAEYIRLGADTVLTNDYLTISHILK